MAWQAPRSVGVAAVAAVEVAAVSAVAAAVEAGLAEAASAVVDSREVVEAGRGAGASDIRRPTAGPAEVGWVEVEWGVAHGLEFSLVAADRRN